MVANLPQHIAIIPDGNRRWAQIKGLSRFEGHQAGAERMHQVVDNLIQLGTKYLTVWGFSCDNWKRTPEEVQDIFTLLQLWIEKDTPWLHENGVKLRYSGRFHQLPQGLQDTIARAIELTGHNTGMTLNLAFNYSGRADILDAVNGVLRDILNRIRREGVFNVLPDIPQIGETFFTHYLYTNGMPDVDLVIRTADEFRISNFMLWQLAYSEFFFTEILWPDFDEKELEKALQVYSERKRRFGGD